MNADQIYEPEVDGWEMVKSIKWSPGGEEVEISCGVRFKIGEGLEERISDKEEVGVLDD